MGANTVSGSRFSEECLSSLGKALGEIQCVWAPLPGVRPWPHSPFTS